jgi:DNA-binding protein HU-beta
MMNRSDLIVAVAEVTGFAKKDIAEIVPVVFEEIKNALVAGDKVALAGFGTFALADRKARKGRNPKTGEEIQIAARKAVKFKPATPLREAVKDV